MKKILGGLLITGMLVLGGCGASTQDEFADAWDEINDFSQYNAVDFSFTLDEMSMEGGTTDSSDIYGLGDIMDSMLTSIQGMGLDGSILIDQENEAMEYQFNLNFMDTEFPFDMVIAQDQTYLSGDAYVELLTLMNTFLDTGVDFSTLTDQLSGKYVEADPEDFGDTFSTGDLSEFFDVDNTGKTTYFADYTRTLDESTFEKDGDKISHPVGSFF